MAQTVRYWNSGSTDAGVNASWQDGIGGASAVPIASNVAVFANGNDSITGSPTALNLALAYVAFNRGFTGRLGGNGTSFTIAANTNGGATKYGVDGTTASGVEKLDYGAGGGYAYITAGTSGIDVVRIDALGKLFLTGGTINTRIEMKRGELDINDQVDLSGKLVELWGGSSSIDWKADGTDPTLNGYGGDHYLKRTFGAVTLNGGKWRIEVEKETNAFTGDLIIQGDAYVDWRAGSFAGTNVKLLSGGLTFKNAKRPIDLSSATLIVAGGTQIDNFGPTGAKVTWPASSAIQLKAGAAAEQFARVAAATV